MIEALEAVGFHFITFLLRFHHHATLISTETELKGTIILFLENIIAQSELDSKSKWSHGKFSLDTDEKK